MDGNGASAAGVGPNSSGGGSTIAASPGGPNFNWGASHIGGGTGGDQLRANGSGSNPAAAPPMDIQQILQQQQVFEFCVLRVRSGIIIYAPRRIISHIIHENLHTFKFRINI